MKSLTKAQVETRDELQKTLREQFGKLEDVTNEFNQMVEEFFETKLEPVLAAYNSTLDDLREWRDGIVAEMDDYEGARSEKWQESDAGNAFRDWKSEYENIDFDDVEIERPEPIELDEENHADEIDNLPTEVL